VENIYAAKMGIGMIMPEVVESFSYGHVWIYSKEKKDNFYPHCIGYYPVEDDIPPEIRNNRMQMLRFFVRNSVRGLYRVDTPARLVMQRNINQIFLKEWRITKEQLNKLLVRCNFQNKKDYKLEGRYSLGRKQPNWDNCSSWVIKVVSKIMNDATFLTCSSPKKLESIKAEIEWDYVPGMQGGN